MKLFRISGCVGAGRQTVVVIESAAVKKDFDADSEWRRGELLVAAIDETFGDDEVGLDA